MLRHHVKGLAFLAIAAALLLLPAGVAYAGKGGSGGKGSGGGSPPGGTRPSTVHPSTVHPSTTHHHGDFDHRRGDVDFFFGFGFGPDYWPWYYGDYPYYAPYYLYEPDYVVPSASVAPRPVLDPNVVYLGIRVPDANADVWINGVKTAQKGTMRPFVSPTLKPGKEYTYEIKAQWQEGGQIYNETRQLTVRPGEQYGINFTASAPSQPKQTPESSSDTK